MPCRSAGTGRAWQSCELSHASAGGPSDETVSCTLHTRTVSRLWKRDVLFLCYIENHLFNWPENCYLWLYNVHRMNSYLFTLLKVVHTVDLNTFVRRITCCNTSVVLYIYSKLQIMQYVGYINFDIVKVSCPHMYTIQYKSYIGM